MADRDPAMQTRAAMRTQGRCAYCGNDVQSVAAGAVDFFRPLHRGGDETDGNALFCCAACSQYKRGYWHEADAPHIRLLHPFNDDLSEHLGETETGRVVPLTEEGRFYAELFHLNRMELVERRRAHRLLERARQLDEELSRRITALTQEKA